MICEICGKTSGLKSCGRCLLVNYCSREHQLQHWKDHKRWCRKFDNYNSETNLTFTDNNIVAQKPQNMIPIEMDANMFSEEMLNQQINLPAQQTPTNNNELLNFYNTQTLNHCSDIQNSVVIGQQLPIPQTQTQIIVNDNINNSSMDNFSTMNLKFNSNSNVNNCNYNSTIISDFNKPPDLQQSQPNTSNINNSNNIILNHQTFSTSASSSNNHSTNNTNINNNHNCDYVLNNLNKYCQTILKDMNTYGFCVIDDFLQIGDLILNEVSLLYDRGLFRAGQVVNTKANSNSKLIRGDRIIWVEGNEQICSNIGFLVRILDTIITRCNAMALGEFSKYKINRRTKAMIACYPGNHTKYVRHVDNPNNDGRCITSIYYLNKDYSRERDGGVLRLFPKMNGIVADIEPKFNRVIFFWSDRRNPHEVMPSTRMRFAITVWYFDANERAEAIQKYKENSIQCPNDKDLVPF